MLSPFNRSYFDLPAVIDPPDYYCITVKVPKDPKHLAAFYGVMYDLSQWINWQRDTGHNAVLAANVWKKIFQELKISDCSGPIPPTPTIQESEAISMPEFRTVCDSGKDYLEWKACTCPETWIRLANESEIGNPAQPGGGLPQPQPGGGCQLYPFQFNANSLWLAPFVVNTGDTITINDASGAGQGGALAYWACVDGEVYFAGACSGLNVTDSGDPAPSINHGELVVKIGATYFEAKPGSFITVPGSVVNSPVYIQANFPLSGAQGSYSGHLTVCNNQSGQWTQTFNFAVATGGWAISGGPSAIWQPGIGYTPNNGYAGWTVQISFVALHATQIGLVQLHFLFNGTAGNGRIEIYGGSTTMFTTGSYNPSGSPQVISTTTPATISAGDHITLYVSSNNSGDVDVEAIYSVVIAGTGVNPFM